MTRGFTLIEVMILLVIGIILAGAALPAPHTLDDQRLIGVARVLEADIGFAQARAIATGQNHRILFAVGGQGVASSYRVESPPGVLLDEPLSRKPWERVFEDGTEIVSASFGGQLALLVDGAGEPANSGTVLLRNGPFEASATVLAVTGEVELTLP